MPYYGRIVATGIALYCIAMIKGYKRCVLIGNHVDPRMGALEPEEHWLQAELASARSLTAAQWEVIG